LDHWPETADFERWIEATGVFKNLESEEMKLSDIEDAGDLARKSDLERFATKQDLEIVVQRLETILHKEMVVSTRWAINVMTLVMLGFSGLILGGVYFIVGHFKP